MIGKKVTESKEVTDQYVPVIGLRNSPVDKEHIIEIVHVIAVTQQYIKGSFLYFDNFFMV